MARNRNNTLSEEAAFGMTVSLIAFIIGGIIGEVWKDTFLLGGIIGALGVWGVCIGCLTAGLAFD